MATIRLKQLRKTYGKNAEILKGIDLDIQDGEFLVLVGPSGCGKSTLLRCIAGLEDISGGSLFIGDRLVNDVPPKERDLAMVFQSYALYPHMTVRENMGFSLRICKQKKADVARLVDEAAEMLGLSPYLERFPKELSGGQRQRVAIGRAIVRRPKVFLFDEPLSNLDANLRAQMRVELKKLHRELGTTMVYVTHDQIEAMTLADRICVLEGGWARQVDAPLNLYNAPNSKFVAEFIGSPPMNFIPVAATDGMLVSDSLSIPLPASLAGLELPARMDVGIRPHDLTLNHALAGSLQATVDVVETVGWDLHLHCTRDGQKLIAQVEAQSARGVKAGDSLRFGIDPEKVKLFNAETSRAIVERA